MCVIVLDWHFNGCIFSRKNNSYRGCAGSRAFVAGCHNLKMIWEDFDALGLGGDVGVGIVGFPAYRSGGVFAQSVHRDAVLVIT